MMQKIQRFGGAMFTPVLLFAFSGIVIGFCTVFQSEVIMGSLAAPDTNWFKVWFVVKEAAWTVFRQVNLLFVVALPIGLAKKQQARACMESFVLYCTFNYALAALLSNWGMMVGALIVAGVAVYLHNRFFDTELPEWLGVFRGSSFVALIGFPVMIGLAVVFFFGWPPIQNAISSLQGFILASGAFGVWLYTFLERILIPTGLHHFIYMPFMYDSIAIEGGIKTAWAEALPAIASSGMNLKEAFPVGGYSLYGFSKMFAPIGIAGAFYATAKPNKKKAVLGLMIPVALTAMVAGITEPIEFTFLFIAPAMFVIHSVLAATLAMTQYLIGITGDFTSGIISNAALNWIPLGATHWQQYLLSIFVGLIFSGIWFVVFRYVILKFDYKTPGREDDDEEAKLVSKAEYKESRQAKKGENKDVVQAKAFLEALGGAKNIDQVTNCATRLRVTVFDESKVKDEKVFKQSGAHGLVHKGKGYQVIVGLTVPYVREEFEKLL